MKTIVTVLMLAISLPAFAADSLGEAKAAFAAGKAAFENGDYETAIKQFEKANSLSPAPSLQFNIGKAYEKLGRYKAAAAAYDKYLELSGAPQTDEDKKAQEELRQRAQQFKTMPDAGAQPPPPAPTGTQPPPPAYPPPARSYPPNYYTPPAYNNPYGYQPYPYLQPQLSREQRLENAKKRRNSGIGTFSAGAALTGLGIGLIAGACGISVGCNDFGGGEFGVSTDNGITAIALLVVGVPVLIVGPILVGVGAGNWAKYQGEMNRIMKEPERPAGGQPQAFIFSIPKLTF